MKNFVIFFLANTGSSAIISHLKKLKDNISIVGFEPFDECHMRNKKIQPNDLKRMLDMLLKKEAKFDENTNENVRNAIDKIYVKYRDDPFPEFDKSRSIGFKMRLKDWETIAEPIKNNDTVVFILLRENVFKWALSLYDFKSSQFSLIKGQIEKNPKVTVDIEKFKEILHRCQTNLEARYRLIERLDADGVSVYPLYYEEYCNDKEKFFRDFFDTVEIPMSKDALKEFSEIPNYFKKVHDDDVKKFVLNYDELKREFGKEYTF